MQHLFLTGPRRAGKTFAVQRALQAVSGARVVGFCTHKSADGGVYLSSVNAPEAEDPALLVARVSEARRTVDTARFDALGTALLADVRPGDIVVMDEVGFLERDAARFSTRILALLDRTDIRILGVCRAPGERDTPLLLALRAHPNVRLYAVAGDMRERAISEVRAYFTGRSPSA